MMELNHHSYACKIGALPFNQYPLENNNVGIGDYIERLSKGRDCWK